jgi:CRISPR/Cas system-associated endonuclease Cas1
MSSDMPLLRGVQKVKIYFVASPGSRIVAKKGGLYIVRKGRDGVESVAISPDVDAVVIASSRIGLSSKTIRLTATRGIDIVFLDYTGYPIARIYPGHGSQTTLEQELLECYYVKMAVEVY